MKATEILMEEHRVIERVLNALETAANRLLAGQTIPMDFFLKAADFIKNFADGCHHKKEEGILFVALAANGMSQETEPLSIMLAEHEEGRHLTRAMREAAERVERGDTSALHQVIQNALDYVALLRAHIQKEDNILFPMADDVIPVGQHQQLTADFNHIELEDDIHEKYIRVANELSKVVTA
ncbi:MAG: hemerythrin domain-containing protein [Anaerolineales bacterium]|nr:hemerythrin domain-containing protein [Anaerolineales bacterium]